MKSIISILYLTFISNILFAQVDIPIGTWRIHTPGRICKTIEKVGNKIYAGSESSFIVYNQDDNTVKSLSKIDGFNGSGVSVLRYHQPTSTLIIGYTDGNIDLLDEDGYITNLNDIKRSNIVGTKQINQVTFKGNLAYLSCTFGIVVIDLVKIEVKEAYSNIGFNGTQVEVYNSIFKGDSIFIATSQGLKTGSTLSNFNLIDFNNWYSFDINDNIPNGVVFKGIGIINNTIFATTSNSEVYKTTGFKWQKDSSFIFPSQTKISIRNSGNQLQFIHSSKIISIDDNFNKNEYSNESNVNDLIFENSNLMWLANSEQGIVKIENGSQKSVFSTNSPYFKNAFRVKSYIDWDGLENMIVTTGGYDLSGNPKNSPFGIYIYRDGIWENYNTALGNYSNQEFLECNVQASYNSSDSSLYIASFNGINKVKRNVDSKIKVQLLQNQDIGIEAACCGSFYFAFNVQFDSQNRGWSVGGQRLNTQAASLFSFKENSFNKYSFSSLGNLTRFPVSLAIDDNDNKWIIYSVSNGGGITVFNEKKSPQFKYLTTQQGEGKLPSMGVNCISKEKSGSLWVGTDKGIAIFNNPNAVLTRTSYDATVPVFENRALLHDKSVKCITIDGANRKWIGTTDGVWLFNEDGSQLIANFTTENSPLPSNNIYDIGINGVSGEVFFATDGGLISYRGNASEPLTVTSSEEGVFTAKVFPNPVTPEFSGQIAITGLPINTNVKITDINGVLVYETQSNGGTAVWNGLTYTGKKAQTGVYLIFATNKEGLQTMVSKFAIVK